MTDYMVSCRIHEGNAHLQTTTVLLERIAVALEALVQNEAEK